jgi:integrase/recombinase XerC
MSHNHSALAQRFLDHIKYERRLSAHTIRAYSDDVDSFFNFAKQLFDVDEPDLITPAMIRSWMADLSLKKIEAKSINRKLSSLKAYFRYGQIAGVLNGSPANAISVLKVKKRLPAYIEKDKMERLLNGIQFPNDFQGMTSYLVISLLYFTGIRVSELVNLKSDQLDLVRGQIKVLGKGNKERIIPISPSLIALLTNYQAEKMKLFPDVLYDQILLTGKQKPPSARQVYDIVSKTLLQVTTSDQRGPHVLRHSFATHLTNNGAELNAVKELLGHTSLAATQVYTHNSIERLRDVHRKFHPKG